MGLCDSCHAGCCRSFAVPVTGADILRIANDQGLSFWDFACRWADPQGQISRSLVPHFHFADEPATPFTICLRHVPSTIFRNVTKCQFLEETPADAEHPLGTARCSIYQSRPSACRTFPTKLSDKGDLVVIYDIPKSGREEKHPAYELCPRPWQPSDVDPVQAASDLVVAKYEMNFFRHVAEVWNRRPQPWDIFPDFVRLVYSERVQRASNVEEPADSEPWVIKFPGVRPAEREARAA